MLRRVENISISHRAGLFTKKGPIRLHIGTKVYVTYPKVHRSNYQAMLNQTVDNRDGGRCRQCGSNVELQFDHIIPVAFGGATSEDNLQILCGPCNRRKGASV